MSEPDGDLLGADIIADHSVVGQVLGLMRDPVSQRVWSVITRYGPIGKVRVVALPMAWVARRTPGRLELGVGVRSLDDLPEARYAMSASAPSMLDSAPELRLTRASSTPS